MKSEPSIDIRLNWSDDPEFLWPMMIGPGRLVFALWRLDVWITWRARRSTP